MKARLFVATLLTSGALLANNVYAGDPVLGAFAGTLAGAAIGHAIDRDATLPGAVFGAVLGAAITSDRDGARVVYGRPVMHEPPRVVYHPAPVVYGPPQVIYAPRPVMFERNVRWDAPRRHADHDRRGDRDYRYERGDDHRW